MINDCHPNLLWSKHSQRHQLFTYKFNNWHASCTWNYKNLPASTSSSLINRKLISLTINLPNSWRVIWWKSHIIHYSKIPELWLITNPTKLVTNKVLIRKTNNRKVTFEKNTHCPCSTPELNIKEHPLFNLDNMYLTIQKHWQR